MKKRYRKKLINKFKKIVKKKGAKKIYLMAALFNKKTIKFYESIRMIKGKEFIEFSKYI